MKVKQAEFRPISEAPKDKVLLTNEGTAIWQEYHQWCLCDNKGDIPSCADRGQEVSQIDPVCFLLWDEVIDFAEDKD